MKTYLLLSILFLGASVASYAACCGTSASCAAKPTDAACACQPCACEKDVCEKGACPKPDAACAEKCADGSACGDKCNSSKEGKCDKGECETKGSCSDKGQCGVEEKTVLTESDVCCGRGGSCCKRRLKKAIEAQEASAKKAEIPMPKMACCAKDA